ncbi:MAG TPA: UDP-2,3-diacylglucosamine diphosphatase [bacterium]|nr:UDP-2,3-diacylglucosamine diphosphatase [bacterium]
MPAQDAEGCAYFLSDLHLGAYPDTEKTSLPMLARFLDHVAATGGKLYIVGDLLDFWFEYRRVIPRYPFRLLAKLKCMIDRGCEIVYIAGNHDYWMGDFLRNEVGVKTVLDALETSIGGRRFFISHGDGIATTRQLSYRALKSILHSRAASFGFRLLHPDIGLRLAAAFSKVSRRRSSRNSHDPRLETFVSKKAAEGFDHIVLGHLHKPQLLEMGATSCLVVGDWIDNFTYGVYSAGKLTLERWPVSS